MNNIRVIICATFALLVAVLAYFYVNSGNKTPHDPLSVEELENELNKKLAQAYLNQQSAPSTPANTSPSMSTNAGFDIASDPSEKAKKAEEEAEIKRLEQEIERQRIAEEKEKKDDLLVENLPAVNDTSLKLINQALVMAIVKDFDAPSLISELEIKRLGSVTPGLILGIRRKNGIIGRVQVSSVDNRQAIADAIPASFFGKPVDIQIGDELIMIP